MRSLWGLSAAALLLASSTAFAADPFTLSSTSFKDGQMMPQKHANNTAGNANCVGQNASPQLSWTGVPDGTKSFALTMVDPEGRGGTGVIHFVSYGIPANVTSFAEGDLEKKSDKFVGGKGSNNQTVWAGPCTPPGSPHHYTFVVIATDIEPKELPPELTLPELHAKLTGHTKGAAGLVGLFVKPQ
jgi:Raf kinase inhibitor-like YbhB/YbcL family protein